MLDKVNLRFVFISLLIALPLIGIHFFLDRSNDWLIPLFIFSFLGYVLLLRESSLSIKKVLFLAVLLRVLMFFEWPGLSDDFYRFIWDGQIHVAGISPYSATPQSALESIPFSEEWANTVYGDLNSQEYFTIYPPLAQYTFWVAAKLGGDELFLNMTMLRLILFLFEMGTLFLLCKMLVGDQKAKHLAVYALNPLVIIELAGNLHYEGVVVFFLLLAIYLFKKSAWWQASISLALGILSKLTPLMLLPILIKKLDFKKAISSYVVIGLVVVLCSLQMIDFHLVKAMSSSLDLFFRKFEFNAGLFFIMNEIGWYMKGYDIIQTLGPTLSVIAFLLILSYSIVIVNKETSWFQAFSIVLFIQLIFATTVHPWYVIPLIAFSSFTGYVFPLVWSLLVFTSYLGYSNQGYSHPYAFIYIEYLIVISLGLFEILKQKPLLKYV